MFGWLRLKPPNWQTVSAPHRYESFWSGTPKQSTMVHVQKEQTGQTVTTECGEIIHLDIGNVSQSHGTFTCMKCARALQLFV